MTQKQSLALIIVRYEQSKDSIERLIRSVKVASKHASDVLSGVSVLIGDCSSRPLDISTPTSAHLEVSYTYFGENLGHSAGCNRLAEALSDDILIFTNPDCVVAPTALTPLVSALGDPSVGIVDGRQVPIEHHKFYDPNSHEQSWASGAFLGIERSTFESVGGFDAEHFWSYCNDVDLSWRIRLTGKRAIHVPNSVVFHDKSVTNTGSVQATETQDYYSTLGRLMLATKFDRPGIVRSTLAWIDISGTSEHRRAAKAFRSAGNEGRLPQRLSGARVVAEFVDGEYAKSRY